MKNSKVTAVPDWNNDGVLRIKGATTIKLYEQICEELSNHHFEGLFFAFTKEKIYWKICMRLTDYLKNFIM